jgi:hypothetical protein
MQEQGDRFLKKRMGPNDKNLPGRHALSKLNPWVAAHLGGGPSQLSRLVRESIPNSRFHLPEMKDLL